MLGRNADGPSFAFIPKGRESQEKKCNKSNLRNQFKMAKLKRLIKKETIQHLKGNVQINVIVNGNVYVWSVTLKSILSYTKYLIWINPHFPLRTKLCLRSACFVCSHAFTAHPCREHRGTCVLGCRSGAPGVIPASLSRQWQGSPRALCLQFGTSFADQRRLSVSGVRRAPSPWTGLIPPGQLQGKSAFYPPHL